MEKRFQLLQGNEACVEGAIAAGMRFYAGYPITPSTEIAERSAVRLPQVGGKFIQMEDEIGGIAAALGASVAGLKAMTATSGPGFSLKKETSAMRRSRKSRSWSWTFSERDLPQDFRLRRHKEI